MAAVPGPRDAVLSRSRRHPPASATMQAPVAFQWRARDRPDHAMATPGRSTTAGPMPPTPSLRLMVDTHETAFLRSINDGVPVSACLVASGVLTEVAFSQPGRLPSVHEPLLGLHAPPRSSWRSRWW